MYPHEIGRDLIPELATRVYSSRLDSFREAVSNAFDEGSRQVALTISSHRIVIEDWGNGISSYDEFRRFGQASKKSRAGEVIGEKGLGKLSMLNLGNIVYFETNNQKVGMRFSMTMTGFSKPAYGKNNAFVEHRGTRITISQLSKKIQISEVVFYLQRAFGLRIANGASISVNGQPVRPISTLDPKESVLFTLPRCDMQVTGNLKADKNGRGIVDIYVDHVFVSATEVDTRRSFSGWVNCNSLTPETSRNNIVQDKAYRDFIRHLRKYASRFPLKTTAIDRAKLQLGRELNTLLKSYIKDMNIDVSREQANSFKNKSGGYHCQHKRDRMQGIMVHANTRYSKPLLGRTISEEKKFYGSTSSSVIRWEYADLGNDKGPIYFVPPNMIYCNTSNDLFRFAFMKSNYYGPTWIRMLPYLARVAVEINKESIRLTPDQFNQKVDEATRYFLKQKNILVN